MLDLNTKNCLCNWVTKIKFLSGSHMNPDKNSPNKIQKKKLTKSSTNNTQQQY